MTKKTPEEMANEYADKHECGDQAWGGAYGGFLAGYQAAELKAKIEFAAKYDHKSPLQVIAAEYVKRRGTTGPLALLEENRFIDGYEAGMNSWNNSNGWISVKDRLPEINNRMSEDVLMLDEYKQMSVKPFEIVNNKIVVDWGESGIRPLSEFTHWMPLPKPPEE